MRHVHMHAPLYIYTPPLYYTTHSYIDTHLLAVQFTQETKIYNEIICF